MLNNLTTKKNIRAFSICPENLTGEKGKAAMATRGSGYYPLQDDISSVAYWYSDNLDDEYPTLSSKNELEIV